MFKTGLKQGTLAWENARATRIGSSEVFDIVRYYASDEELQNCGISAEDLRNEKPYTTAWALYHKMIKSGIYQKAEIPPELSEYGHALEPIGIKLLQRNRAKKLKSAPVYANDKLIVSLDILGTAEEIDEKPFDYGTGKPKAGQKFVCEQKTLMPQVLAKGLPIKYILQAQHQITQTKTSFYILQLMVLKNDSIFERGKICQMSVKKRGEYLSDKLEVHELYFQNNEHLGALINACLDRFFEDVENRNEPTPFIENDKTSNILESIRLNTFFNNSFVINCDLTEYVELMDKEKKAQKARKDCLQSFVEMAMKHNGAKFRSPDGTMASFSADGKFLIKAPKI